MADEIKVPRDADISGLELVSLFRIGWQVLALCPVVGIAVACIGITLMLKKYEAVGMIRIGQIDQIRGVRGYTSQLIEFPAQAPANRPAHLIEAAYAVGKPVLSKSAFFLTVGALAGFLVGLIWVFIRDGGTALVCPGVTIEGRSCRYSNAC